MTFIFDPGSPDPDHAGIDDLDQIQENLKALRQFEASAAEPANPYVGQCWFDISSSPYLFKQRNSTNTGWITLWELNTAGAPKTHADTEITDSVSAHGILQGHGGGFDADTIDLVHLSDVPQFSNIPDGLYDNLGTEVIMSLDTERSTNSTSYVLKKEWELNKTPGSSIKISFQAKMSSGLSTGNARIFRNDVGVGTERTLTGVYQTFTETISGWSDGDKLQLKAKSNSGTIYFAYVKELRILGSKCVELSYDA